MITMTLNRTFDLVMFGKKKLIRNCGPADEAMCETSEQGERLLEDTDLLPVSLGVGQRLLELFGNQDIANLVFRLRSTPREISSVIHGDVLPSVEMLLGIRKITGASIDWLLTGEGSKFGTADAKASEREASPVDFAPWVITDGPARRPKHRAR